MRRALLLPLLIALAIACAGPKKAVLPVDSHLMPWNPPAQDEGTSDASAPELQDGEKAQ